MMNHIDVGYILNDMRKWWRKLPKAEHEKKQEWKDELHQLGEYLKQLENMTKMNDLKYNQTIKEMNGLRKVLKSQKNVDCPLWKPDQSQTQCFSCKAEFTFFNRRHHCRACGNIFDNNCCSNYIPLPMFGAENPKGVRVCNACYEVSTEKTKPPTELPARKNVLAEINNGIVRKQTPIKSIRQVKTSELLVDTLRSQIAERRNCIKDDESP